MDCRRCAGRVSILMLHHTGTRFDIRCEWNCCNICMVGANKTVFNWNHNIGFSLCLVSELKPRKQEEVSCDCETDEKPSFWQSRTFLGIITVFAALMITFPHYGHIFYPKSPVANVIFVERNNIQQIEFKISGMTCASCAEHVNYEVHKLNGIIKSNTSYENGTATIEFNNSEITASEIEKSINSTGYPVISKK